MTAPKWAFCIGNYATGIWTTRYGPYCDALTPCHQALDVCDILPDSYTPLRRGQGTLREEYRGIRSQGIHMTLLCSSSSMIDSVILTYDSISYTDTEYN